MAKGATPPAGPGKFSRRSGGQVVATPDLSNPDVQYGDISQIRAREKVAPLPVGVLPPRASTRGERSLPGGQQTNDKLPAALLEQPSTRPNEPVTAGLPVGAGPGPESLQAQPAMDVREAVLVYLVNNYGNPEAEQMLADLRRSRQVPIPASTTPQVPTSTPTPQGQ